MSTLEGPASDRPASDSQTSDRLPDLLRRAAEACERTERLRAAYVEALGRGIRIAASLRHNRRLAWAREFRDLRGRVSGYEG